MRSMTLDQSVVQDLRFKNIGQRIRTIREELRKEYGNDFTGKSVAARLQEVSQSKLNFIERGQTQSIDAVLLHEIAKEFGTTLEIFFDDYYEEAYGNKTITLKPKIYKSEYSPQVENVTQINNPLVEKNYKINVQLCRIASNGDYQIVLNQTSRETHDDNNLRDILTLVLQILNMYDIRENPTLVNNMDEIKIFQHIDALMSHINSSFGGFPFYSSNTVEILNKLHEEAILYTNLFIDSKE